MPDDAQRPPTLIEVAIEPKSPADAPKLAVALTAFAAEDPCFGFSSDAESGQTILEGQNELHLDIAVMRLRRQRGIEVAVGAPQVAYRETIATRIEKDYTYKKQTGGTGQFARVKIVFEPAAWSTSASFGARVAAGAVPKDLLAGAAKGVTGAMAAGILAGFPVVGVKATLIDGAFHDVDSSAEIFETAARNATREALREGGATLLEPIMSVEVSTPEDHLGSVVGDLRGRRGQVLGQAARGTSMVVDATVPLVNLFGYPNQLRAFTRGLGHLTMRFSHYAPVDPPSPPRFPSAAAMRA